MAAEERTLWEEAGVLGAAREEWPEVLEWVEDFRARDQEMLPVEEADGEEGEGEGEEDGEEGVGEADGEEEDREEVEAEPQESSEDSSLHQA
jgi:hypothetical protein